MVSRLGVIATCVTFIALSALAHAEPRHQEHVSITLEPLYLVATMVDTTIEVRAAPRFGLAAIAGYGRPLFGAQLWNLGAEANAYVMRDFYGLHVGVEYEVMGGSFGIPFVVKTMDTDPLRIYGGYVGYKCVTRWGFTSIVQMGVGHIKGGATSTDPPMSKVIPIANFTAGWSF